MCIKENKYGIRLIYYKYPQLLTYKHIDINEKSNFFRFIVILVLIITKNIGLLVYQWLQRYVLNQKWTLSIVSNSFPNVSSSIKRVYLKGLSTKRNDNAVYGVGEPDFH